MSYSISPAPSRGRALYAHPAIPHPRARYRGHRGGGVRLVDVSSVLAPALGSVSVRDFRLVGDVLYATICCDGRCYSGSLDLSDLARAVGPRFAAYHQALHDATATDATPASTGPGVATLQLSAEGAPPVAVPLAPASTGNPAADAASDVQTAGAILVGALADLHRLHRRATCAQWWDQVSSWAQRTLEGLGDGDGGGDLRHVARTLRKYAPAIASAAGAGAGSVAGPNASPVAVHLVQTLLQAAAGDPDAIALAAGAQAASSRDPGLADALAAAKDAIAKSLVGFHVAETISEAAAGNRRAGCEVTELVRQAAAGKTSALSAIRFAELLTGIGLPRAAAEVARQNGIVVGFDLFKSLEGVANDIGHAVSSVAKGAAHYALHPSDIARDVAKGLGAPKSVADALSYVTDPFQDVTENPMVQSAVAAHFGGPAGTAALNAAHAAEQGNLSVSQLAQAATAAAPMLAHYAATPQAAAQIMHAASALGHLTSQLTHSPAPSAPSPGPHFARGLAGPLSMFGHHPTAAAAAAQPAMMPVTTPGYGINPALIDLDPDYSASSPAYQIDPDLIRMDTAAGPPSAAVSGWFFPFLAGGAAGAAAEHWGPSAYQWLAAKIASHESAKAK